MFEHTRVTGTPDCWIALPDGYVPGCEYERTVNGTRDVLAMMREVNRIIGALAPKPKDQTCARLIVAYSPVLLDDPAIRREVEQIRRSGKRVGVVCTETHDANRQVRMKPAEITRPGT